MSRQSLTMDYRGEDNMERKGFFITLNIFLIIPMKANYFFQDENNQSMLITNNLYFI